MEYQVRIRALSAAIVIALGAASSLITSTVVASRAYRDRATIQSASGRDMTVKGLARAGVRSDLGVWTIGVSGEGQDLKAAYANLEFGVDRVQAFLHAQGFVDSEIGLGPIDTDEQHMRDKDGRDTHQISGYSLHRAFTITSVTVDRISHAAGEVTQLLQENVRVASFAPQYTYTKAADLKVQLLGEAARDARSRAAEIASNSGCAVGDVRRAQMGVIQITRPNSTEVSGMGMYDTSTIDKDVSVVVTVTFGVQNP